VAFEQLTTASKQRSLSPEAPFQAFDYDAATGEIDILALEEGDLPDPKAIEIDQGEEREVTWLSDRIEEGS
jgi:hypothetical protein